MSVFQVLAAGLGIHLGRRLARVRVERAVDLALQHVGEAEDGVERRAQLVAQHGEEGRALARASARLAQVGAVAALGRGEARHQQVEGRR